MSRFVAVALALAALALAPSASAQVQPYGSGDNGYFNNILPPGENGFDNALQLAQYEANKTYPPHNNDQLQMYSNLTTAAPNIQASQLGQFYKDATFGVRAGAVAGSESPEPGVTIVRDASFGVPHIYGDTRAELMFGIGYATAEDRLFFIDVLRHAGDGTLAQFAGGSNVSMDESVWASEPYTDQDLQNQVEWAQKYSPYASTVFSDETNYVAGINAYIKKAQSDPLLMPGEYAAIGQPLGPQPFSLTDLIRIATLVGGIFGNGGGDQLNNAMLYENLANKFGGEHRALAGLPTLPPAARRATVAVKRSIHPHKPRSKGRDKSGFATFLSFDAPNDPEAPTTVRGKGKAFPYQTLPKPSKATLKTIALPDRGSVQFANPVASGAVPHAGAAASQGGAAPTSPLSRLLSFPHSMSNALVVSAKDSSSGHPLMVAGPQVAYFSPEILMEEDIHGPGVDAEGAAFPGVNLYVELGHGRDYAWSATSSGQNIVDTFAVPLCSPGGGPVSASSAYYLLQGRCVPMETLTRSESWTPNAGDQTPPGSVTFQTQRTAYGLVVARARVHGRPVVYCNLRSTYMHELDSAVGFYLLNNPDVIHGPRDFFAAAYNIGYTFNWFYADPKHTAYYNSGLNPVRGPHTNPLFPSWASDPWQGFRPAAQMTPASLTEKQTAQNTHPHVTDQPYLTSWNNKQAPGYNDGATGQQYSSIFRSQLLDLNLNHYLAIRHGKLSLVDVVNAMGNAGTQDLRGVEVLPYALKILGHPGDPTLGQAVSELRTWVATGSHRINRAHPGTSGLYEQADAVRTIDAWWPLLVKAEFQPVLGPSILGQMEGELPINDEPGHGTSGAHLGSSWDVGFYGIVQKDLRSALGDRVRGPLNRVYCGSGSLKRCRAALSASLRQAIAETPQQVYPADKVCAAGDQMCSDSIQFRAIGAITQPLIPWINRPTFQQADDLLGYRPG
jgi:acyl-homoserine lactone acylase PvdQ